jgi:hypothetical protein
VDEKRTEAPKVRLLLPPSCVSPRHKETSVDVMEQLEYNRSLKDKKELKNMTQSWLKYVT